MKINENFKKRLQKLAGIIKENTFIGPDGQLNNFDFNDYISGEKEFIYSITYQEIDKSQFEDGEEINDYTDQGFEIEPTHAPLYEIIENSKNDYGIHEHVGSGSWSSTSPDQTRDYFEKGLEKYFSLHINHIDKKEITKEEEQFITKLLNPSSRAKWDDLDNKWKNLY